MAILDAILLVVLVLFIALNLFMGLIHAIGSLVGLVGGLLIARWLYIPVSAFIDPLVLGYTPAAKVIAFILIFSLVARIAGLVFHYVRDMLRFLPLVPTIDRLGGAILGLVEGVLAIGISLSVIVSTLTPTNPWSIAIIGSTFAGWLIAMAHVIYPLVPQAYRYITTVMP